MHRFTIYSWVWLAIGVLGMFTDSDVTFAVGFINSTVWTAAGELDKRWTA